LTSPPAPLRQESGAINAQNNEDLKSLALRRGIRERSTEMLQLNDFISIINISTSAYP
jgi:hypothetical protein